MGNKTLSSHCGGLYRVCSANQFKMGVKKRPERWSCNPDVLIWRSPVAQGDKQQRDTKRPVRLQLLRLRLSAHRVTKESNNMFSAVTQEPISDAARRRCLHLQIPPRAPSLSLGITHKLFAISSSFLFQFVFGSVVWKLTQRRRPLLHLITSYCDYCRAF